MCKCEREVKTGFKSRSRNNRLARSKTNKAKPQVGLLTQDENII